MYFMGVLKGKDIKYHKMRYFMLYEGRKLSGILYKSYWSIEHIFMHIEFYMLLKKSKSKIINYFINIFIK